MELIFQILKDFLNVIKIKIPILSTWNASDIVETKSNNYFGNT